MAENLLNWFQHSGIFSLILCFLLISEVFSNDGVCTRNEVVSKSRPRTYYRTFMETFWDWCMHRYQYFSCMHQRVSGKYITEQESYTELETKQFCCTGYEDARNGGAPIECKPVCDFTCSNGKCTRPNYCECNSGYVKKPETENICEPVCSQECIHGYCSRPEFCNCDFGYEHNSSLPSYVCSPVCSNSCVNADCTSPEVCTCLQGFAKTLKEPHRCHAVCSLHCHNAVCTAPDECTCFEGFERDNSSWNVCNPVCSEGCTNAACTAPDECTCFNGFKKINSSICEPKCTQGCVNGRCTRPEICSCFPGYQSFSDDPYSCLPVCSPGCVNSNCTEPDRCECSPGFEESDDPRACRPYCSKGCENGVCTQPEECTCLWGFESGGNSSNCNRREGENLDCTFIDEIVNHDFDKYCFKLTRELSLKSLGNCNILQYLASHIEEIGNAALHLYCEEMSDLEQSENSFGLRLECVVKLDTKEEKFSSEEFTSTLAYNDDRSDLIDSFESTTQDSSLETSLMTEVPKGTTETSEIQNTTDKSELDTTIENDREQAEFNITSVGISSKTTKLSALPLHLNTTLKFLPLIASTQMTQDYFINVTSRKTEWCLCHQNQKNWSICASSPVRLYLCPCEPRNSQILMEESRTTSSLKTVTILVLISMAALLVGFILYSVYQSGSFETQRSAGSNSRKPELSIDLVSLDDSNAEENT